VVGVHVAGEPTPREGAAAVAVTQSPGEPRRRVVRGPSNAHDLAGAVVQRDLEASVTREARGDLGVDDGAALDLAPGACACEGVERRVDDDRRTLGIGVAGEPAGREEKQGVGGAHLGARLGRHRRGVATGVVVGGVGNARLLKTFSMTRP
jgi:hypothetical protein